MAQVFILLVIMLILGVPIAYAIGLAATYGLLFVGHVLLTVVPQRMYTMLDTFSLLAIPFFVLAGNLMEKGGISRKLIAFANSIVGHIKGGLGMVDILSCMLFGAISGSGAAASAAIGGICIPEMRKQGYDKEFAGAITAVSGPLGIIIPPSVVMVIYATTANVSVGSMFMAGYLPGILIGLLMMVTVYFVAKKKGYPAGKRATFKQFIHTTFDAIWAIFMIVIIMGGIFSGFFTATEAACVSVVYALLVGFFIYKELKVKDLVGILVSSVKTSAGIMFCVATTNILAWLMTSQNVASSVAAAMTSAIHGKVLMMIVINIIYLILGTFLDSTPAIILSVPVLLPLAQQFGIDPVHFGIITTVNLAIGMSTPPVGITLFVSSKIADTSLTSMVKPMVPLWGIMIAALMLITFYPPISMLLVNLL